jgi:hypothetical protein
MEKIMRKQRQRYSAGLIADNEEGVAIISVLLILMLLTFIGITATKTTTNEKKMVRSEAIFERDFFLAESAAMEGVQKMANESTPEELLAPLISTGANNEGLLVSADPREPENDLKNLDADSDNQVDKNDFTVTSESEIDPNNLTFRRVVQLPIASGDSLALGASRIYSYASYGYSENSGGRAMIKVGYRKRF